MDTLDVFLAFGAGGLSIVLLLALLALALT